MKIEKVAVYVVGTLLFLLIAIPIIWGTGFACRWVIGQFWPRAFEINVWAYAIGFASINALFVGGRNVTKSR